MAHAVHEWCDACGSPHLVTHCKAKGCTWWKCQRCGSYGNESNHFDPRPKKAT